LDSKWWTPAAASPTATRWFATAHATGEVRIHALTAAGRGAATGEEDGAFGDLTVHPNAAATGSFAELLAPAGRSKAAAAATRTPPALCLSLNWRQGSSADPSPPPGASPPRTAQIVSSYSNGHVAVHDVIFSHSPKPPGTAGPACHVVTRDCWPAHSLFTSPSEVWSAAFVGGGGGPGRGDGGPPLIATGGDDGTLKLWDLRSTSRPASVVREPFDAGVTCVSPHPRLDNILAAGSYDERVSLFDVRHAAAPLFHSSPLGGGVWRLQWHPLNDRRLLVAAMHGGCQVAHFKGLVPTTRHPSSSASAAGGSASARQPFQLQAASLLYPGLASCPTSSFDSTLTDASAGTGYSGGPPARIRWRVKKCFEEHESMVYGASWLACRHPTQPGSYFEAAASCSFYDRAVYAWDSVL
jgi:WD40 repeat protein